MTASGEAEEDFEEAADLVGNDHNFSLFLPHSSRLDLNTCLTDRADQSR